MKPVRLLIGVAAISLLFALSRWPAFAPLAGPPAAAGAQPLAAVAAQAFAAQPVAAQPEAAQPDAAQPAAAELAPLEAALLGELNAARGDNDLPLLAADARLTAVARARSADMLVRDYFAHTSPDGRDAYTLLDAGQVPARFAGENLARNNWPERESPARAVAGFMASESHRLNLLNELFTRAGVGVAVRPDGMKIYTVLFAGD
jgi:uncharacterized protein YkwD